jgi:hypothetical protein
MGVVIGTKLPVSRKRSLANLLLLLVGLGLLLAYAFVTRQQAPSEDWTVARLAQLVNSGEVVRLYITHHLVVAEASSGTRALVTGPEEKSVVDTLSSLGVPAERLRAIEIVPTRPPGFEPAAVLKWLWWGVPIFILVGIAGFTLRRAQHGCQLT